MDLRFVGILFIFGSCLAAVFLHCLDRFLLGRNLKRVCKSQELPGPRKCSPHKCDPLLDGYFPTNPNTMCGYIPPPPSYGHEYLAQSSGPTTTSYEDEYGYLPHYSGPTNTRPSFFNWAAIRALSPHSSEHDLPSSLSSSFPESAKPLSRRDLCGPTPPHSSEHDLPESSDPADILPKSDSCKVVCDRAIEIYEEILRESFKAKGPLPSSPMGPMGPIDKGYVKHFPVADLHRNQLWVLQNWTRATAMSKLPGISAAATSVTGCDSAHVIGMDEWKDCSAAQPTGEALMNNLL